MAYPRVDVTEATHTAMFIESVDDDAPTVIEFGQYVNTLIIAPADDVYISFDSDTIATGYSKILQDEIWSMDIICEKIAVQSISGDGVEVRVQVLWGENE